MRARLLLLGLLLGLIALLPAAVHAAVPGAGTVSQATPTSSWTGGPFLTSNPSGLCLTGVDPSCDTYALTITPPATGNYTVEITTTPSSEGDDYDLYVNGPSGATVGSSTTSGGHEKVVLTNPPAGTYSVSTLAWLVTPGGTYQGKATLAVASTPPPGDTTQRPLLIRPERRAGHRRGAVARRRRRLRPGRARRGEDPRPDPGLPAPRRADPARPGLARRRVAALRQRDARQPRAQLLQQHEAVHRPVRVQVEAAVRLRPGELHAGPLHGDAGELDDRRLLEVREPHTTSRATTRPAASTAAPARSCSRTRRFGSSTARRPRTGSRPTPRPCSAGTIRRAARVPAANPGYTVYILNTWDSAEARAILKPQNEYHVWKINRTDPDTGQFDGIDWARIWGGRYRFMMVDAGAAPNPYEAETLGQPQPHRLRLGELRAAAVGVPRERAAAGHARQHRRGRRAGAHAGRDLGRRTSSTSCSAAP